MQKIIEASITRFFTTGTANRGREEFFWPLFYFCFHKNGDPITDIPFISVNKRGSYKTKFPHINLDSSAKKQYDYFCETAHHEKLFVELKIANSKEQLNTEINQLNLTNVALQKQSEHDCKILLLNVCQGYFEWAIWDNATVTNPSLQTKRVDLLKSISAFSPSEFFRDICENYEDYRTSEATGTILLIFHLLKDSDECEITLEAPLDVAHKPQVDLKIVKTDSTTFYECKSNLSLDEDGRRQLDRYKKNDIKIFYIFGIKSAIKTAARRCLKRGNYMDLPSEFFCSCIIKTIEDVA